MGSYYGIILRNDIMELYYAIIFMTTNPADAWDVPGAPWDPEDFLGTPLGSPGTRLGALGTPLGRPVTLLGTPLGPQGTPLGHPRDAPRTPRRPPGTLMDHKNGHISTNVQHQKFSIAVFKPACWGPSHEGLPRAVLSIKEGAKIKEKWGGHPMGEGVYG